MGYLGRDHRQGGGDFFRKNGGGGDKIFREIKGAKTFILLKKGGDIFPKTLPRYPVNFDLYLGSAQYLSGYEVDRIDFLAVNKSHPPLHLVFLDLLTWKFTMTTRTIEST